MELRYTINLLPDGSVVHRNGEYLGQWTEGIQGGVYDFTPDGEGAPVLYDPYRSGLCSKIETWHGDNELRPLEAKKPAG